MHTADIRSDTTAARAARDRARAAAGLMLASLVLGCASPRNDVAAGPASEGVNGGSGADAAGAGGSQAGGSTPADRAGGAAGSAALPGGGAGGMTGGSLRPDAGGTTNPPSAPACGVMDGICLMGCPATALDPDCPNGGKPAKLDKGMLCAGADACASGACVDGVCCDGACNSPCQTCAAPGLAGTCLPLRNETDPGQCEGTGRRCTGAASCAMLDQHPEGASEGITYTFDGTSDAQLVTVGQAGRIAAVGFRVDCMPGGALTIEIQSTAKAIPTGTVLASAMITEEALAAQKQPDRMIAFAQPAPLTAGQQIAIVIHIHDATCIFQNTSSYAPGYTMVLTTSGTWSGDDSGGDFQFQTWMLP